jgi:hypothetical protein
MFMLHPGSFKPESIANRQIKIQIVDTHKTFATRISIGFAACQPQLNRTLLKTNVGCLLERLLQRFKAEGS